MYVLNKPYTHTLSKLRLLLSFMYILHLMLVVNFGITLLIILKPLIKTSQATLQDLHLPTACEESMVGCYFLLYITTLISQVRSSWVK